MLKGDVTFPEKPPRAAAIVVAAVLVVFWSAIRLAVFRETMVPLTYVIPLLVGVWTRDRRILWGMAAAFAVAHTVKMLWLLPDDLLTDTDWWANYAATMLNIGVGSAVVQMIIALRERLDGAIEQLRDQADELRLQAEELAQQNEELTNQGEELSRQTEELSQQGEELASQNEELQTQSDEIRALNTTLGRREAVLQALLDTTIGSAGEQAALEHIAAAARELFGGAPCAIGVYEHAGGRLLLRATAPDDWRAHTSTQETVDDFVSLVLHEQRTAAVNDISLRPDLTLSDLRRRDAREGRALRPDHPRRGIVGRLRGVQRPRTRLERRGISTRLLVCRPEWTAAADAAASG